MQARRKTLLALVLAVTAMACEPALSQVHPHHLHHGRLWFLYHPPQSAPLANPFPDIPHDRYPLLPQPPPDSPVPYPEKNHPSVAPSFSEGMSITVTKILNDNSGPDDKRQSGPIDRPKQAAEQLATCWRPPVPERDDTVEVTLRFAFDKSGNVLAPARITYLKAGRGTAADQKSAAEDVRKSIFAALKACTPLHFTRSMAASAPGYPLSVRFIGRRETQTESRH
jgi:hypothetical protein